MQVEKCDGLPFVSKRNECQHFSQNSSQFWARMHPQPRLLKMNSDELQVQVTTTGVSAQRCFSATELSLIRVSAMHVPVSSSLL